ncbi:hypothetical protein E8E15_001190 [Penicillium rubens]|nr:hypothetical protein E8E15_001190 [Penicillium rubens]KAJ5033067.1 hypothetical protein NUH16_003197 [Penicillium rubens]
MTCDIYVSEEANNRSPQLVPQQINYKVVDEPPPFASDADCDKGTHDRPRKPHPPEFQLQRREGDGALMRITGPDKLEAATRAEQRPLYRFPKQSKVQDLDRIPGDLLPPLTTTPILEGYKEEPPQSAQRTLPPLIPSQDPKSNFSPQRACLLSLAAISTGPPIISVPYPRTSTTEGLSPYSKCPDLQTRISLPSLQSLALDTSRDTQSLPSIHSALGFLQCEFSSAQTSGVTPPYSYSQFATSHESSPRERQLPSLSARVPPGLLSHPSLISTIDIYANASPVSEPSFWRTPTPAVSNKLQLPPPPSSDPNHHAFSVTATTPATNYPTPTETVVPAAGERMSSSSQTVPKNESATTNIGEYKCTHSGCTAAPFQTQYMLK